MNIRRLALLASLLICSIAHSANNEKLMELEAKMLQYISTNKTDTFLLITEQLKQASKEAGDERLFYKAWGNQAIYEATQQSYNKAMEIHQDITSYARDNNSIYGEYYAIHTKATILLQKQDYNAAEAEYLKAVDFLHRHFPNESAGEDLQELMKIANHRKDGKAGVGYARQILAEPNVAPIHKGRALYRLSQMAFNKNDTAEFNRIYQEMQRLKQSDGISTLKPVVEVNHYIINGQYEEALRLTDELDEETSAERKAVIYHLMGDDANAFRYMQIYKRLCDSITLVSHGNVVASCYVQMNNERLQLEQHLLERQNERLRNRFYITLAALAFLILLYLIYKRHKLLKLMQTDFQKLQYQKNDAERALDELNELSYFESRTELPLNESVKVNSMCDAITTDTQAHCHKGVTTILQTDVADDFEIRTNADAVKQLITHLMNYAARFTEKGFIVLRVEEDGDNMLFSVTDTSAGLSGKSSTHIIGMFAEHEHKVRYVGMNFNICQSITRLLRGRIWHDTEYTHGTRFCVEIPKK